MTGRENIYLNGAVLGMTRAEVRRKFDEIVAFAEVESFLETPVKRYSSGMYVRLAFAVAAHLEPEILLVDEVLAVGDAEFQKKCLGKMGDVARGGRTVLFVSHNMGAIQQLCPTSIWLDGGRIADAGPSPRIVAAYLKSGYAPTNPSETVFPENPGKEAQLLRARVLNHEGIVTSKLSCSEPVILDLDFQVRESTPGLYGYLELMRTDGLRFLISYSQDVVPDPLASLRQGRYSIRIAIPPLVLGSGEYSVYLNFQSRTASKFYVDSPGFVCGFVLDDSASGPGGNRPALLSTRLPWSIRQIAEGRAA
jgi:lipopolysaccharide transport system ATP-binding protein